MRRMRGFTLIELIVTMVIMAIVSVIAVPNMTSMIVGHRAKALGEDVVNLINLARSEAVKRGGRVVLCASSDGASCTGGWTEGMIVVVDGATQDNSLGVTAMDVIARQDPLADSARLTVLQGGSGVGFVRFTSSGLVGRVSASPDPIVFAAWIDGCTANSKQIIEVGVSGMVSVARESCGG